MDLNEKIAKMAISHLADPHQFLVEVIISGSRVQKKIVVIIDGDHGVTIEDCAKLSRALSTELDEENLIEENYTLEVSTPGIDFPLKLKRQYKKNIGRGFKITLKDKTIVKGILKSTTEESIQIDAEEKAGKKREVKTMDVPFDQIEKAFVQVSFK